MFTFFDSKLLSPNDLVGACAIWWGVNGLAITGCKIFLHLVIVGVSDSPLLNLLTLVSELNRTLGVDLPVAQVYRHPTVGFIASLIEPLTHDQGVAAAVLVTDAPGVATSNTLDVTYAQQQFWIKDIALYQDGGEGACGQNHISIAFKVFHPEVVVYLTQALDTLIRLHPILSSHFSVDDDRLVATVMPEWRPGVELFGENELSSDEFIHQVVRRSFVNESLTHMPAMRWGVVRAHDHAVVAIVLHHSIADNHSLAVLWPDLISGDSSEGRSPRANSFAEYVHWLRTIKSEMKPETEPSNAEKGLESPIHPTKLKPDQPPGLPRSVGQRTKRLSPDAYGRLERFAAAHACSINTVLAVAWIRALSSITEHETVCLGLPVSQRVNARWARTVGCLVQTLPLGLSVKGKALDELVQDCHAAINQLVENCLIYEAAPTAPQHFPVLINFVNDAYHAELEQPLMAGVETVELPITDIRSDVVLDVVNLGAELELRLSFRRDLFTDALIDRLLAVFYAWLDVQALPESPVIDNAPECEQHAPSPSAFLTETPDDLVEIMAADIAAVFAEELKLSHVQPDDDFFQLGGHSLSALRVIRRINERVGLTLSVSAIFEVATPRGLVQRALLKGREVKPSQAPMIIHKQVGDPALPTLVMLHPAIGVCRCYEPLTQSIQSQHPIVWVQASGFEYSSLEVMADHYLAALKQAGVQNMTLVGYSFGGALGLEMANQACEAVEKLLMIDVSFKVPYDPNEAFVELAGVEEFDSVVRIHRQHAELLAGYEPRCGQGVDTRLVLASEGESNAMEWMERLGVDWAVKVVEGSHGSVMGVEEVRVVVGESVGGEKLAVV